MKLVPDLEAALIKATGPASFQNAVDMTDAQGVIFLCPACYKKNAGAAGTHSVMVWWKDPGPLLDGNPIWKVAGTGLHDLTLSPSIDLTKGRDGRPSPDCTWHGFISGGSVI